MLNRILETIQETSLYKKLSKQIHHAQFSFNPISHGVFFSDFDKWAFLAPPDYLLNYKRYDNETW